MDFVKSDDLYWWPPWYPCCEKRPLKVLKLTVKRHAGECADDDFRSFLSRVIWRGEGDEHGSGWMVIWLKNWHSKFIWIIQWSEIFKLIHRIRIAWMRRGCVTLFHFVPKWSTVLSCLVAPCLVKQRLSSCLGNLHVLLVSHSQYSLLSHTTPFSLACASRVTLAIEEDQFSV